MESTIIKKIDHFVIVTKDIDASIAFYSLLGFTCKDCGSRYEFYTADFKINVHYQGSELKPNAYLAKPGTLDICFEVDTSLSTLISLFNENGIETTSIEMKTGVKGSMQSFYVRDPDQNLLEFCNY